MSWILAGGRGAGGWQVYFVDLAFGDMKKEACYNFYLLSVGVLRGLRICITSVWVGIQLFIPMRSRIQSSHLSSRNNGFSYILCFLMKGSGFVPLI
jgi:hypothetical protein